MDLSFPIPAIGKAVMLTQGGAANYDPKQDISTLPKNLWISAFMLNFLAWTGSVQQLPNQIGGAAELNCTALLVKNSQGVWVDE